jgi:hypothetical protein
MNRILTLAGTLLVTAALTACSPGINTLGGRITFDSSGMVVHAIGHPNAHVSRDGDLSIGGKTIAVTPAQRQLLQQYYREARGTMDTGKALGEHGVAMAERGIGDAISSIFNRDASTADKRMQAESKRIESGATALCTDIKALDATQKAIATDIPAFAPYAAGNRMHCKVSHSTTVSTNASGGKAKTTTTLTANID